MRGRPGTGKLEGGICARTRKTCEVMAYLKLLDHFVTLGKMCSEYNLQTRVSGNFLRVPSSQESTMPS